MWQMYTIFIALFCLCITPESGESRSSNVLKGLDKMYFQINNKCIQNEINITIMFLNSRKCMNKWTKCFTFVHINHSNIGLSNCLSNCIADGSSISWTCIDSSLYGLHGLQILVLLEPLYRTGLTTPKWFVPPFSWDEKISLHEMTCTYFFQ